MFRQKAINLMKPVTQGPRRGVRLPAVDQTYDGRPVLEGGDLTNSAMMTHDAATIDLNAPKRDGVYCEYSRADDPIGSGAIPPVVVVEFPARLHERGPTSVIPLDVCASLSAPARGRARASAPISCYSGPASRPGAGPTPPLISWLDSTCRRTILSGP